MTDPHAAWHAHQRARFMRPDAARYMRPDAARYIRPDVARFLIPGTDPADVFLALKYSPTQRRVPAGRTGGGRWTDEDEGGGGGGSGGSSFGGSGDGSGQGGEDVSATSDTALGFAEPDSSGSLNDWNALLGGLADGGSDPQPIPNATTDDVAENLEDVAGGSRGRGGPGNWFPGATPGQLVRLDQAVARSEIAIAQVRQYEPNWLPGEQSWQALPGSVEGAISRAEARATEGEVRYEQLRSGVGGNFAPPLNPVTRSGTPPRVFDGGAWIDIYRTVNNSPDLFGRPSWPLDNGTVAAGTIDGQLYFGINSRAPGYTTSDWNRAAELRDAVVAKYPNELWSGNIGRMPNDGFFHAEADILGRAARARGGSLENMSIEVYVDREVCWSCSRVLPKLGLELGNPYVTYIERQTGERLEMWNGRWLSGRYR